MHVRSCMDDPVHLCCDYCTCAFTLTILCHTSVHVGSSFVPRTSQTPPTTTTFETCLPQVQAVAAIDGHAGTVHDSSQACRLRSKIKLPQYCCHFHLTVFIIPPVVFMMRATASAGIKYSICLALLVLYSLGFDTPSWNLKSHSSPPAVLSAWTGGRADVQTHNTYY